MKCGSEDVHAVIESRIDFSYRSGNKLDLQFFCLKCNNVEEYIP
jgi:hypothetical protein